MKGLRRGLGVGVAIVALSLGTSGLPAQGQDTVQDYGWKTPLPQTGKLTIRQPLRAFNRKKIFAACPNGSALYAFAESTNYKVQICAVGGTPRYYMSRGKTDSSKLTFEDRGEGAQQLVFKRGDYSYILYRDGRDPSKLNAYLQVYKKDKQILGEALLYLYEG